MNLLATSTENGPILIFIVPCLFVIVSVGIVSLIFQIKSHRLENLLWKLQPWTILFAFGVALSLHFFARFQLRQFSGGAGDSEMNSMRESLGVIQEVDNQFLIIIITGMIFWLACMIVRLSKRKDRVPSSDGSSA